MSRATSSTRRPDSSVAPTRSASRSSASSTSRARLVSGNSLPPASSWRLTPMSRKNATVSGDGNARSTRRTIVARPPQKSRSVTATFVTLQRDPPLTRIFAPGFLAPSSSTTDRPGLARRAKMAVARPAAPAPTMTMSAMPLCYARCSRARGAEGPAARSRKRASSGSLPRTCWAAGGRSAPSMASSGLASSSRVPKRS